MLSQQEKDIIKYGTDNGQSRDSIVAALTRFRQNPPAKVGRFKETIGDIKETFGGIKDVTERRTEKMNEIISRGGDTGLGGLRKTARLGANLMGGISENLGEIGIGVGKAFLSQEKEEAIKNKFTKTLQSEEVAPKVEWVLDKWGEFKQNNPEAALDVESFADVAMFMLDVAGFGLAEKGAAKGIKLGREAIETGLDVGAKARAGAEDLIQKGVRRIPTAVEDIGSVIKPKPSALEAVGQVLQGETKDVAAGARALSRIDTTNIKTFKELGNVINAKIPSLSRRVDDLLDLDPTRRTLKELAVVSKTSGGKTVKTNPVKKAMEHLEELYMKSGRAVEAAEMREAVAKGIKDGLTSKEINQLARTYGREASGFSKVTDKPLTSVSAELYENTRKALKDVARDSINGKQAQALDGQLTDIYRTQKLIKKNIELVNKAQQKVDPQGLIGKILNKIGLGGGARGMVLNIIRKGDNKSMDILKLESVLERNLKILNKAIKAKTDKELLKLLDDLLDVKKASSATPKKKVATKKVSKVQKATTDYKKIKPIAEKAQKKINEIANKYVKKYGGDVADPGIKPEKSWVRKVVGELDGDSTRITDTARNSIVTTKPKAVYKDLLKRKDLVKSDFKTHLSNELGFEGGNVRLKIGDITAEIQVVTPDMVFAKEEAKIAKSMLGNSKYQEMLSSYGDIGGEGHTLYEKWRKLNPDSNKAQAIATRSKKYYNQFMK